MTDESKTALNCHGDTDGKLTFIGSGGWTEPWSGNTINTNGWGDPYTFKLVDSNGNEYNPANTILDANEQDQERSAVIYDFLSNGAKIRIAFGANEHFIYWAWAEAPTFNLYGAQSNPR